MKSSHMLLLLLLLLLLLVHVSFRLASPTSASGTSVAKS